MSVFPIRLFGDPVLRTRATEVESFEGSVQRLMRDLMDTLTATPNGAGLAAPQIGILKRVFAWRYEGEFGCLANPRIIDSSGSAVDEEGCLFDGILFLDRLEPELQKGSKKNSAGVPDSGSSR